ncbi:MAG: CYTH domain-containing protein, partial [Bacilli bacterium]
MKQEVEREWKGRISEAAFHSIIEYANHKNYPYNAAIQVNYYFDTDDYQLRKNNMMVRIRQKEDQYECTMKIAIKEEKTLSQSTSSHVYTPSVTQEYTVSMDQAEAFEYLTGKTTLHTAHPIVSIVSDHLQRK